jgi:hypothetical protein
MEFFYTPIITNHLPVSRKPAPGKIPEVKHLCPKTNRVIAIETIEHEGKDVYVSRIYKTKNSKPIKTKFRKELVQLPSGRTTIKVKRIA